MKINRLFAIMSSIILVLSALTGCGAASQQPDKITSDASTSSMQEQETSAKTVIATTFAAYDWVKNVVGTSDTVQVKYLVDSKVDLHSYQPSAEDILEYQNSDLIFAIGGESEEWIKRLSIDDKVISLIDCVSAKEEELTEGMQCEEEEEAEESEEEPEYDEHIWLSLINARTCVQKISDELSKLDPDNAEIYSENSKAYIAELNKLNEEYKNVTDKAAHRTILFGDRFPFRYLIDDYGLDYYAAFVGCSAETEASFETIAFLANKINTLSLRSVCVIGPDHSIADAIIRSTDTKDQTIVTFDSMQSISNKEADSLSYLDIMQENLRSLTQALKA